MIQPSRTIASHGRSDGARASWRRRNRGARRFDPPRAGRRCAGARVGCGQGAGRLVRSTSPPSRTRRLRRDSLHAVQPADRVARPARREPWRGRASPTHPGRPRCGNPGGTPLDPRRARRCRRSPGDGGEPRADVPPAAPPRAGRSKTHRVHELASSRCREDHRGCAGRARDRLVRPRRPGPNRGGENRAGRGRSKGRRPGRTSSARSPRIRTGLPARSPFSAYRCDRPCGDCWRRGGGPCLTRSCRVVSQSWLRARGCA